jgi:16S rRNA (uracil1498-N3)-methyltransferase
MQYLYHENSGQSELVLSGDEHHYVFKVRRDKVGNVIALRNLRDNIVYFYEIVELSKKDARLQLKEQKLVVIKAKKNLHIGWCIIETKNIEKMLPSLNEMGVGKITFITCKRTQQNSKIDFARLQRIILNSSQQCGVSELMELDTSTSLIDFLNKNPTAYMLNFSANKVNDSLDIDTIVVGCEGGFELEEVAIFDMNKIVGFDTPLILRSESAICAVASKILI